MTRFNWLLDGSIVGLYLLATMAAGLYVRKYVGKVEHFLVAGREMDVYLGIASLAATEFGIVTCMYTAQNGYEKGFAGATPGILMALAMLVVGVTGFCIKPLRDSGVMTIPELIAGHSGRGSAGRRASSSCWAACSTWACFCAPAASSSYWWPGWTCGTSSS